MDDVVTIDLHPRTPAGSPDGGKFAAKVGGGEADAGILDAGAADPSPAAATRAARINEIMKTTGEAEEATDAHRRAAIIEYTNTNIDRVAQVLSAICPRVKNARWEDTGDAYELALSTVACPHSRNDNGNPDTDIRSWAGGHDYDPDHMDELVSGVNARALRLNSDTPLERDPHNPNAWTLDLANYVPRANNGLGVRL